MTPEELARADKAFGELGPPRDLDVASLPELTPDVICNAFEENPLNANSLYKQQWLKVRGKLVAGPIKADMIKAINVYVLSVAYKNKVLPCVFFGAAKEEELKQLKKGQELVVLGRYDPTPKTPSLNMCSILSVK